MVNDSIVDERALHEIYLKPFEIAVKEGNPWTVMCSYNRINGVYACDNDYLLKDVLKGQWNYEGVVISDWHATNHPILSHNHGLDIEMPCPVNRKRDLLKAIKSKRLSMAEVDDSSSRVLKLLKKAEEGRKRDTSLYVEELSDSYMVEAVEKSAVLLENKSKTLPLKHLRSCCAIGAFAKTPRISGGGSSRVNARSVVSFLDVVAKKERHGIRYSPGFSLEGEELDNPILDAVDLASSSDTVLLFLGLPASAETEGADRKNMLLPDDQLRLFDSIYKVNKNIVVILTCGSPVELPFADKAKAILLTYLAGENGAEGIYNLLVGKASPSGRLAESWPTHLSHVPSFGFYPGNQMQSLYRESLYVGYRYYETVGQAVRYPFGYGLSYAQFEYGKLSLSRETIKGANSATATIEVSNVSKIPGEVTVLLFQDPPKGNVFKPARSLLAFQKIQLDPGKKKKVNFSIKIEDFAHYDIESASFKVEGGVYQISVGLDAHNMVSSASIKVESPDVFESRRNQIPCYYAPSQEGFLSYDNDFDNLLGRHVATPKDPKSRPYDWNSTIADIEETWIGKKLWSYIEEKVLPPKDHPNYPMMIRATKELPLRSLGDKEKLAQPILDMANGKLFHALIHFLFPHNRR